MIYLRTNTEGAIGMKITFLGTCSGTEPMPGRKHTSFAIEAGGAVYVFDAGEGCSYTAHLLGVDMMKLQKIIISHTHIDHVGGLMNLLWVGRKLLLRANPGVPRPKRQPIDLYLPDLQTWEGLKILLSSTEASITDEEQFHEAYPVTARQVTSGLLFDDGIMRVTAFPNTHVKGWQGGESYSYSYLIECEGKRLVYSGDVGKYEELDPAIGEYCDGLIIETGHFGIDNVRDYAAARVADTWTGDGRIGRIFFNHHGREILNDLPAGEKKVLDYFGDKAIICWDGMTVEW